MATYSGPLIISYIFGRFTTLYLAEALTAIGAPTCPCWVVIMITPAAERAPYIAAADASFSTCILSISLGLIVTFGSESIPSITYKGLAFPYRVLIPRMFTTAPCPGPPEFLTTTPDDWPCSASGNDLATFVSVFLVFTTDAAPVRSFLRIV